MNTRNPYTPPTAPVSDAALPVAVTRKPISVWLLQIVCVLAVLMILMTLARSFGAWREAAPDSISRVAVRTSMLVQLLIVALLVWTLIAAQLRSQFGRWLGVFIMGSLIAILMLVVAKSRFEPETFATVLGRYTGGVLVLTPLGLLLYFPAFSKRARAWYAK
jgi:hypothetical protein